MQLQQISLALYSWSLDIRPAKPLRQGLPACRTSRSVQVTAAMRSLSVEVKPTTLLLKVHHSPTDPKLKLCNPTMLLLKPVWVTAIPCQSHRVMPTRVCSAMQWITGRHYAIRLLIAIHIKRAFCSRCRRRWKWDREEALSQTPLHGHQLQTPATNTTNEHHQRTKICHVPTS